MVSLAIQCRGEDYKFLTASRFDDIAEGHAQYENVAIPTLCDQVEMSEVRWATADDWILVPGADREEDFTDLEAASDELGFDVNAHTCE